MSPSYGSDGFRYLRDRALGRIGAAGVEDAGFGPSQQVQHAVNYTKAPWNYFALMFAYLSGGYTKGVDYDAIATVYPNVFPNATYSDWYIPDGAIPGGGVGGHIAITDDNYDNSPASIPDGSVMICDLVAFTQTFNWDATGTVNYDQLTEVWLTREKRVAPRATSKFDFTGTTASGNPTITAVTPPSGTAMADFTPGNGVTGAGIPAGATILSVSGNTITLSQNASASATVTLTLGINLLETGNLFYDPDYSFHNGGTLLGDYINNGVATDIRQNTSFVTTAPLARGITKVGTNDRLAYMLALVKLGIISPRTWMNGWSFGIEPKAEAGPDTHGGRFTINSLSRVKTLRGTTAYADLMGANIFSTGDTMASWAGNFLDFVPGEADMDGGTTAYFLREQTNGGVASSHEMFVAAQTVPSRAGWYVWTEDLKNNKGRDEFQYLIAANSFAEQLSRKFNLSTMVMGVGADIVNTVPANQLQHVKSEIIDIGQGYREAYWQFYKPAGITTLFVAMQMIAGTKSYIGDITKGITARPRHRLSQLPKIVMSGTPPTPYTGAAYSFVPVTVGGQGTIVYSFDGSLPSGWTINTATGEISGTTATAGAVTGNIVATGADGFVGRLAFSVNVTTPVAPSNTVAPVVTNPSVQQGLVVQDQTLPVTNGTWSGTGPLTYEYQRKRNGTVIGSGTGFNTNSYVVQAADDAAVITTEVRATGPGGTSAWVAAVMAPTAIAGTLRLNENFTAGQGSWSSSGGVTYTGGILGWNTTAFNGVTVPATGTNGKQFRTIADYVAGANPGVRFGMGTGGAATPFGAIVTTSQKIDQTVTESGTITQFAVQFTGSTSTVGSLDNILVVERP